MLLALGLAFVIGMALRLEFLLTFFLLPVGLVWLGFVGLSGVLASVRGWRLARAEAGAARKIAALVAAPAATVFLYFTGLAAVDAGSHAAAALTLAIQQRRYAAIIAAGPNAAALCDPQGAHGVRCQMDEGPPRRFAFAGTGILDNWSGIVFDPSGKVAGARGFDPATHRLTADPAVTGLFGGDLVACAPLWGGYYDCSFT